MDSGDYGGPKAWEKTCLQEEPDATHVDKITEHVERISTEENWTQNGDKTLSHLDGMKENVGNLSEEEKCIENESKTETGAAHMDGLTENMSNSSKEENGFLSGVRQSDKNNSHQNIVENVGNFPRENTCSDKEDHEKDTSNVKEVTENIENHPKEEHGNETGKNNHHKDIDEITENVGSLKNKCSQCGKNNSSEMDEENEYNRIYSSKQRCIENNKKNKDNLHLDGMANTVRKLTTDEQSPQNRERNTDKNISHMDGTTKHIESLPPKMKCFEIKETSSHKDTSHRDSITENVGDLPKENHGLLNGEIDIPKDILDLDGKAEIVENLPKEEKSTAREDMHNKDISHMDGLTENVGNLPNEETFNKNGETNAQSTNDLARTNGVTDNIESNMLNPDATQFIPRGDRNLRTTQQNQTGQQKFETTFQYGNVQAVHRAETELSEETEEKKVVSTERIQASPNNDHSNNPPSDQNEKTKIQSKSLVGGKIQNDGYIGELRDLKMSARGSCELIFQHQRSSCTLTLSPRDVRTFYQKINQAHSVLHKITNTETKSSPTPNVAQPPSNIKANGKGKRERIKQTNKNTTAKAQDSTSTDSKHEEQSAPQANSPTTPSQNHRPGNEQQNSSNPQNSRHNSPAKKSTPETITTRNQTSELNRRPSTSSEEPCKRGRADSRTSKKQREAEDLQLVNFVLINPSKCLFNNGYKLKIAKRINEVIKKRITNFLPSDVIEEYMNLYGS